MAGSHIYFDDDAQDGEKKDQTKDTKEEVSEPPETEPEADMLGLAAEPGTDEVKPEQDLKEQHYTIFYDDIGVSYETIIGPYLKGAKEITVEDPYIRVTHQIHNFIRFCETMVRHLTIRKINLITSFDDKTNISEMRDSLEELKQSLLEMDIILDIKIDPNMHDREIRIDNGWLIKIGRGLDFYQKPNSWFQIGVYDLSLRKCLETKVDIFRH